MRETVVGETRNKETISVFLDNMKKFISLMSCLVLAGTVMAKPAYRGPIVQIAEDGTEKTVYLHGDESFSYMTDEAGEWLDETTLQPMTASQKQFRMAEQVKARRAPKTTEATKAGGKPNLAPHGLVILVNFQDQEFVTPADTIDSLLTGYNFSRKYSYKKKSGSQTITVNVKSKGSARQYFYDQSYGSYNPTFDVIGPVTINHDFAYYGEPVKDAQGNITEHDKNPREMIREACLKADEAGVDFSQYDNDGDGYVDFVYVIYAGYGEADGGGVNTVWPHQWSLAPLAVKIDGKTLGRYACGCEMNNISKVFDGIGTFCHEFSHVLGLPDLYVTVNMDNPPHTLGSWSIMDYGPYNNDGNTPPAYSAYERFYMGWLTPRLLVDQEKVTLHNINNGTGESLLISEEDQMPSVGWNPTPKVFYMLEARVQKGWDEFLAGEGMLITKIQYDSKKWQQNTVNNDPDNMGVDILEAKANYSKTAAASDAFPAGATQWTALEGHEVMNISRNMRTGAVIFYYRGDPQGIEDIEDGKAAQKILRDGKVVIIRGGVEYDLNGQQL